jgi:hypothetical protein
MGGGAVDQAERGGAGKSRHGTSLAPAGQPSGAAARTEEGGARFGLNFDAGTASEWLKVAYRALLVRLVVSLNALLAVALAGASNTSRLTPIKWAIAVGVVIVVWTLVTAYFLFASTRKEGKEIFTRVIVNVQLPVDVVLSYLAMSASTSLADISLENPNTAAQAVFMFFATFALIYSAAFSHILADRHSVALGTYLA